MGSATPVVVKTQFRNPYDEAENKAMDDATSIDFTDDPGMTLQAPAEEQDINVIMKRFGVKDGSILPYWTDPKAVFGDFSEIGTDPVEAAEAIRQGNVAFMALPADIRRRFDSGPQLYNWVLDPKNEDEARRIGLLAPKRVSINPSSDKEQVLGTPDVPTPTT